MVAIGFNVGYKYFLLVILFINNIICNSTFLVTLVAVASPDDSGLLVAATFALLKKPRKKAHQENQWVLRIGATWDLAT